MRVSITHTTHLSYGADVVEGVMDARLDCSVASPLGLVKVRSQLPPAYHFDSDGEKADVITTVTGAC